MGIYIFIYLEILILAIFIKNKKTYCSVIGISMFLVSGFRGRSVGTDTFAYLDKFQEAEIQSFTELFLLTKDPGFYIFLKILSWVSESPQFFLIIIAAIFCYSITKFIYKFSRIPEISFLLILALNFFNFSMTGIRQTIALSILLFSYEYLFKNKTVKFILTVLFASVFHQTAVIFLIPLITKYNIFKLNRNKIILITSFLLFIIYKYGYIIINEVLLSDALLLRAEYEATNTSSGLLTLTILSAVLILSLFNLKNLSKSYHLKYMLLFSILSILFQAFVAFLPEFFRLSMYFNIFLILFIPLIIDVQTDKITKSLLYPITIAFISIMYLYFTIDDAGVVPYKFLIQ